MWSGLTDCGWVASSQGLHAYFQENGFLQLHSPILTSNDSEGAGEQFRIAKTGASRAAGWL